MATSSWVNSPKSTSVPSTPFFIVFVIVFSSKVFGSIVVTLIVIPFGNIVLNGNACPFTPERWIIAFTLFL